MQDSILYKYYNNLYSTLYLEEVINNKFLIEPNKLFNRKYNITDSEFNKIRKEYIEARAFADVLKYNKPDNFTNYYKRNELEVIGNENAIRNGLKENKNDFLVIDKDDIKKWFRVHLERMGNRRNETILNVSTTEEEVNALLDTGWYVLDDTKRDDILGYLVYNYFMPLFVDNYVTSREREVEINTIIYVESTD